MSLINIRTKHQPDVRNFFEITDPGAHCSRKFPRLKPVAREVNPGGLFADRLLVSRDGIRRNLVVLWIVLVSSPTTQIKAGIEFPRRRRRNMTALRVQCYGTSHQQQVNCLHCTSVGRALRLPNWQPDCLLDPKHVGYEKENHWKRSNERGPAQSAHSRWRLRNPWPHHR